MSVCLSFYIHCQICRNVHADSGIFVINIYRMGRYFWSMPQMDILWRVDLRQIERKNL